MTVIVSDTFTDTNSTSLDAHTPNTSPENWTERVGLWQITSNAAVISSGLNRSHSTINHGEADLEFTAVVDCGDSNSTSVAHDVGLAVRWSDTSNYWTIGVNPEADLFRIVERNTAVETTRASASVTMAIDTVFTITAQITGTSFVAQLDGGNQITYGSASLNSSSTVHGILLRATTARIDSYEADDGASGGSTYAMSATLTAISDTNAPNTAVARPSTSTLTAISDTNAPLLSVARPQTTTQTAISDTNAPLLAVTRPFAATLTAVSSTDAIAIAITRVFSATLTAISSTDGALLAVARPMRFDDAVAGSGGVAQGLLLALTQTLEGSSGGPHAISDTGSIAIATSGVWALSATLTAISDTNAPLLFVTRPMGATLTGISSTGDVLLSVARALSAILTAVSNTDSIAITTAGEIAMSAVLTALSSTNDSLLAVGRPMTGTLTAVSSTDTIALTRGLAMSGTLTAITDTSALQLAIARQLAATLTAQSNTDAALVAVARRLSSTLTAQSSTSDISLLAAMIVGLISASFAIRQPGAGWNARPPTVTFTTRE